MVPEPAILIVDLGSQLTLLIARTLRECGYRSVVLSPQKAGIWAKQHHPTAVILSGSGSGVHDVNAPQPPEEVLESGVPILGICYGMQWLIQHLGGEVADDHENVEYGPALVRLGDDLLFRGLEELQDVWASHGDSVLMVPQSMRIIAEGHEGGTLRAIRDMDHDLWGVQFHPEVIHTPCGRQILVNFVRDICACKPDWEPADIVAGIRDEVSADPSIRAVLGFSGGVDSTTMAAILAPALEGRLMGVCIDGGQLRMDEIEEIKHHANAAGIPLWVITAHDAFAQKLAGITDAEEKRRAFKALYLSLLKKAAADFGATHVVQGTLATDEIESGVTGGALIKSHHNVDLDWEDLGELKPLSPFFKYEVRALAAELGLPDSVVHREPFPGPGLFIRIIGAPVTPERLTLVRSAEDEVRRVLRKAEGVPEISQLVVALCCVETTGVKGDDRAYGPTINIRAVHTTDFMTVKPVFFSQEVVQAVTSAITRYWDIVRVWWDFTPKPPATTEFE